MKEVVEFLTSLSKAVSTMGLYKEGHPARERVVDDVFEAVQRLQEVSPRPEFTFLGEEIILDRRPIRALKNWDWAGRLGSMGVQRLEFTGPVSRDDLDVFLEEIHGRYAGGEVDTAEVRQGRPTNIRYGMVGLAGEGEKAAGSETKLVQSNLASTMGYTLQEEIEAVDWIHSELKDGRQLHMLEAEALVRSLTVAMHGDQDFLIPLLRLKQFDQYTTTHAMNVSVLAMALAEFIGLGPKEVRTFGISGLLHDLGKVTIPAEILNKPGKLDDEERAIMNRHTIEGARIIIETEDHLDLAAVVAYEHHIKINGAGYPAMRYARRCHQASDLVHVCDVFDALRTHRPYREAWEQDRVIGYMEEGAGTEFDADLVHAFIKMIKQWSHRIATIEAPDTAVVPADSTDGLLDGLVTAADEPAPPSTSEG